MPGFSSARHGTARAGTARNVRAVPTCRFGTCRLGTYCKSRTKTAHILVKILQFDEESRLSSFLIPYVRERTFSHSKQDSKKIIEFEFAFHASHFDTKIHKEEFSIHNRNTSSYDYDY